MDKKVYKVLYNKYGTSFKRYRENWDKAGRGEVELDFPLHLNLELNFGCNLKCPSCLCSLPSKDWPYKVDPKQQISYEKFCEIIDESISYGLPSVELNGVNEPLLHKDIVRCIRYASLKGIMHISLHTNALSLSEKLSKEIIDSGLTNISFSLDAASKDIYNKIRKNSRYATVLKNIDNFLKIKGDKTFPLTRVSLTRNKINSHEISLFKEIWKGRVDDVSTSFFYNPFVGSDIYKKIEKEYRIEARNSVICYQPFQRLFIFNNGNVAPCCSMFGGNLIVGNIYDDSLYNIWNGDKIKELRKSILDSNLIEEACRKCNISYMGKEE